MKSKERRRFSSNKWARANHDISIADGSKAANLISFADVFVDGGTSADIVVGFTAGSVDQRTYDVIELTDLLRNYGYDGEANKAVYGVNYKAELQDDGTYNLLIDSDRDGQTDTLIAEITLKSGTIGGHNFTAFGEAGGVLPQPETGYDGKDDGETRIYVINGRDDVLLDISDANAAKQSHTIDARQLLADDRVLDWTIKGFQTDNRGANEWGNDAHDVVDLRDLFFQLGFEDTQEARGFGKAFTIKARNDGAFDVLIDADRNGSFESDILTVYTNGGSLTEQHILYSGVGFIGGYAGNPVVPTSFVTRFDGTSGNDTIIGGDDRDLLYAGLGDDFLIGGRGRDNFDGQSGKDTMDGVSGGGGGGDYFHSGQDGDYIILGHENGLSNMILMHTFYNKYFNPATGNPANGIDTIINFRAGSAGEGTYGDGSASYDVFDATNLLKLYGYGYPGESSYAVYGVNYEFKQQSDKVYQLLIDSNHDGQTDKVLAEIHVESGQLGAHNFLPFGFNEVPHILD